jgi:hypothetical protein
MQPFAAKHNARLVLINRRDHPGSAPYTESERAQLISISKRLPEEGRGLFQAFMRDRALEIHDFMCRFIEQERIPVASGGNGGFVFVSWSYGVHWLSAFLLHAESFAAERGSQLSQYIRRSIIYGIATLFFVNIIWCHREES